MGGLNNGQWRTPAASVTEGNWYHILYTIDMDGAVSTPNIYIDGVDQALVVVNAPVGAPDSIEGVPFIIGNIATLGALEFNGQLKYVEAWDRILTPGEAYDVYQEAGFGAVEDGLVFQGPCVRTADLDYYEDLALSDDDKLLDNMYGMVGTQNDEVVTRLV